MDPAALETSNPAARALIMKGLRTTADLAERFVAEHPESAALYSYDIAVVKMLAIRIERAHAADNAAPVNSSLS